MAKKSNSYLTTGLLALGALFLFKKKKNDDVSGIGALKTIYSMERAGGYGQYRIIRETGSGKTTRVHTTDSQAFDDYTEGTISQARLKRLFDFYYNK